MIAELAAARAPHRPPVCRACKERPAARRRTICLTCKDRRWRERHFEHHLWCNLRKSARRRGLDFTIALPWWHAWCEMTGFAEMVGRTKGAASIDRVEPWRGYHPDNIQILEVGANAAKGQRPPPIPVENDDPY